MKIVRPFLIAALLVAHLPAHAASFNCNKGRSLTERMICNDPALSRLDDTLGQLYWKARRRVIDRHAFITDSDSKWAWREANCRDAECLGTWYTTRIEELQRLIASMQTGAPVPLAAPAQPREPVDTALPQPSRIAPRTDVAMLQCTAAHPGIVMEEQCPAVIQQNSRQWKYRPRGGDWFCGVAMLGRT
ncbi:hypothetical protein VOM14_09830 [Paraburkholderia sp. MPAMCS5]|uniref:lysozyme inhibitor LprI family protein n=1 Tax=Paraburkholderia sp. MPAMCS5 TaxID=3112563 RepID=UPI002E19D037|nr:hypothetical protein [Paraburkholderia sp. MPAMCS5]